jgi:hypothetical protein
MRNEVDQGKKGSQLWASQVLANQSQTQIQSRAFITSVVSIFLSLNIKATFFICDGFRP